MSIAAWNLLKLAVEIGFLTCVVLPLLRLFFVWVLTSMFLAAQWLGSRRP